MMKMCRNEDNICAVLGEYIPLWEEYLPPTNVVRIRFSDFTPYVAWVCCWFYSARRGCSPGTPVSPSPQKRVALIWFVVSPLSASAWDQLTLKSVKFIMYSLDCKKFRMRFRSIFLMSAIARSLTEPINVFFAKYLGNTLCTPKEHDCL